MAPKKVHQTTRTVALAKDALTNESGGDAGSQQLRGAMKRLGQRQMLQLALGAPDDPNADDALLLILDTMCDEARALGDGAAAIAHACRMRALKTFVEDHIAVSWSDETARAPHGEAHIDAVRP